MLYIKSDFWGNKSCINLERIPLPLTFPILNSLLGTNNTNMPSKLLKNSSILFFSFPFAGSNIITSFFFILCTITKWLNPSFVITWAIDGKVYFSLNPTLSTLIALASKPNFLAPFSNPNKVVPFISVPRISLNLVIVTSFL